MSCVKLVCALGERPAGLQEFHLSIQFCHLRIQVGRMPFELEALGALHGHLGLQALDRRGELVPLLAQGDPIARRRKQVAEDAVAGQDQQQQRRAGGELPAPPVTTGRRRCELRVGQPGRVDDAIPPAPGVRNRRPRGTGPDAPASRRAGSRSAGADPWNGRSSRPSRSPGRAARHRRRAPARGRRAHSA